MITLSSSLIGTYKKAFYQNQSRVRLNCKRTFVCQFYTLCFIGRPCIVERLTLITMYWNHSINTSSRNETIQDVFVTVKQWGV